jgi:hypothetical protein
MHACCELQGLRVFVALLKLNPAILEVLQVITGQMLYAELREGIAVLSLHMHTPVAWGLSALHETVVWLQLIV